MPKTVFISGANRGIGLEFARQYLEMGWIVAAASRRPGEAAALQGLQAQFPPGRLLMPALDLNDPGSIEQVGAFLSDQPWDHLDLLINNAGIFAQGEHGVESMDYERALRVFQVNYFGPLLLTKVLLPWLTRSAQARVAVLTSRIGALRPPAVPLGSGGQFSYACSKAAVNRMVPILGANLASQGIWAVGLDPGWVDTDMTSGASAGERYKLSPAQSVRGMIQVIESLQGEKTGRLLRFDGAQCRWYAPLETEEEMQLKRMLDPKPASG